MKFSCAKFVAACLSFGLVGESLSAEGQSFPPKPKDVKQIQVRLHEHPVTGFNDNKERKVPAEMMPRLLKFFESVKATEENALLRTAPEICDFSLTCADGSVAKGSVVWRGKKAPLCIKCNDHWYIGPSEAEAKDVGLRFYGEIMDVFDLDHFAEKK